MPRIRTIKPEIATDKKLARLSRDSRYTLVMAVSQADDYGLLPGNPRQLLGALYPHDDTVTEITLSLWLEELRAAHMVRWRRTRDDATVLEVVNWERHQKVDHPHKPVLRDQLVPYSSRDLRESLAATSREVAEDLAKPSRTDLGPNDLTTPRPNDRTTEQGASPSARARVPSAPKDPPKYPHFALADRQAAYAAWERHVGPVEFGELIKALGPAFKAAPTFAMPDLERAIEYAAVEAKCLDTSKRSTVELSHLTPRTFVRRLNLHLERARLGLAQNGKPTEFGALVDRWYGVTS